MRNARIFRELVKFHLPRQGFSTEKKGLAGSSRQAAEISVAALNDYIKTTGAESRAFNLRRSLDECDPESYRARVLDVREHRGLVDFINMTQRLNHELKDAGDLLEMAEEAGDAVFADECHQRIEAVLADADLVHTEIMMGDARGVSSCYLEVTAGAGGDDANDWASMLVRMYRLFGARKEYTCVEIEEAPASVIGIKSCTLRIDGKDAFGWLQLEPGVHRLVRVSNGKRHTSFAHVAVYPSSSEDDESSMLSREPPPASEIRVDTYRAQGAGGQHVNVTESAVRLTHLPTGLVATCQRERSQHRNKASAMKLLTAKIAKREADARLAERSTDRAAQEQISWGGQQVRSYVLSPYQLVKDARGFEVAGNAVTSVLDGAPELEDLLRGILRERSRRKSWND